MHVVLALRDLAGRAAALDPNAAEADDAAVDGVAGELRGVVERAVGLMVRVQRLEEAAAAPTAIADLCFAGALELTPVLRDLSTARCAGERVVAAERARRKVRRAIHAVLELAPPVVGEPEPSDDVRSALAVRRLYTEFRRGLRRPAAESADAVLGALRYAACAFATLFSSPAYADVRASDRAVLRYLRDRVLAWAHHDRAPSSGLHLLEDVYTCGDLLRGINRRQELRDHDRAAAARLAGGPIGDANAWLAEVDALFGLDDALDEALEHARAAPRPDDAVPILLERIAQLP